MRLIYHPDAEAELVEAARFYETRVAALGGEFLDAIEDALQKIQEAPDRWPIIESDVHSYLMQRFPYAIYYRIAPDHIRLLAFKHHSRHPRYWHYRIAG